MTAEDLRQGNAPLADDVELPMNVCCVQEYCEDWRETHEWVSEDNACAFREQMEESVKLREALHFSSVEAVKKVMQEAKASLLLGHGEGFDSELFQQLGQRVAFR
jgi:hypothetical protein